MGKDLQRKITLKDISLASGYTVGTVSHALNNRPDIPESTREKIRSLAKEMGYFPNAMAAALRSGNTKTVALIVCDIACVHFSYMARYVESLLRQHGYTTMIFSTDNDSAQELEAVRIALNRLVDGVIICPLECRDSGSMALLRSSGTPYVVIGRHLENEDDTCVLCNDEEGGYLVTRHLLDLGHRRLMYVGIHGCVSSDAERFAGYCRALREMGIEPEDKPYLYHSDLTSPDSGAEKLSAVLKRVRPTAAFAFCDEVAYSLCNSLSVLGLRVPEDFSVAGFDHIAGYMQCLPPLTSVASVGDNISTVAAIKLLALMNSKGGLRPETILTPVCVVLPKASVSTRKK